MASWDTVCQIASGLPGAELDAAGADNPAWRVNGKVMVRRNPRLDDTSDLSRGEVIAIRIAADERAALMEEDPDTFLLTEHWSNARSASILVRLSTVSTRQLKELITEAWRSRATRRQQVEFEGR